MSDLIRRQNAIDALMKCGDYYCGNDEAKRGVSQCIGVIHDLPSAQPQRKTGKWIYHSNWESDGECGYECSECGMGSDVDYGNCMRCGARMDGESDE